MVKKDKTKRRFYLEVSEPAEPDKSPIPLTTQTDMTKTGLVPADSLEVDFLFVVHYIDKRATNSHLLHYLNPRRYKEQLTMPFLLIPVAAVGYKAWERRQQQKAEQEKANGENGEPSLVVDTLPSEVADKLPSQGSNASDDTYDMLDSNLTADDDDQTRSTMNDEQLQGAGGLFGIRRFIEDKMDEHRARELHKQQYRELATRIARGEVPAALPKISYK